MKILLFSDPHMASSSTFAEVVPYYRSSRVANIVRSLEWVAEQIEEHKPDQVVCLGDVIHNFKEADHRLLGLLRRSLFRIIDVAQQTIFIYGNHDIQEEEPEFTIYQVLGIPQNIIPFVDSEHRAYCNYGQIEKLRDPARVLFIHEDPQPFYPIEAGGTVLCGHFHKPSLQTGAYTFHFVGALLPESFRDANESMPFGITLFDDTATIPTITRVDNPHSISFRSYTWLEGEVAPELNDAHYNKVLLVGSTNFFKEASKLSAKWLHIGYKQDIPLIEAVPHEEIAPDYVEQVLTKWGNTFNADIDYGLSLYQKTQNS